MTTFPKSIPIQAPKWLVWPLAAVTLLSVAGHIWLEVLGCGMVYPFSPTSLTALGFILNGVGFAVLGALLIYYRPENRVGWLAAGIGVMQVVPLFVHYARCGLAGAVDLAACRMYIGLSICSALLIFI
jgi:hypothetical protein